MSKKRHSESGSLISLCGCLHAACIIHADQGFSLHPHILNAFAPLWPLCGRGRFKAPGGTEVTSLKQLLVKINGCIFKNPLIWPNHIWGSFKFLKENWLSKTRAVKTFYSSKEKLDFAFYINIMFQQTGFLIKKLLHYIKIYDKTMFKCLYKHLQL